MNSKYLIFGGLAAAAVAVILVMKNGASSMSLAPAQSTTSSQQVNPDVAALVQSLSNSPTSNAGQPVGSNGSLVAWTDPVNHISWFLNPSTNDWWSVLPNTVTPPGYVPGTSQIVG